MSFGKEIESFQTSLKEICKVTQKICVLHKKFGPKLFCVFFFQSIMKVTLSDAMFQKGFKKARFYYSIITVYSIYAFMNKNIHQNDCILHQQ